MKLQEEGREVGRQGDQLRIGGLAKGKRSQFTFRGVDADELGGINAVSTTRRR